MFLVVPPLAGSASIAGANEKRYCHASMFVGVAVILRMILRWTVAHVAQAALGTLIMSGVQGGDVTLRMVHPWRYRTSGSLEWMGATVNYLPSPALIGSCTRRGNRSG